MNKPDMTPEPGDRPDATEPGTSAPPPGGPPPRSGEEAGEEPDYRFTLANERTFLAWIRTALALMAAAVAVVHLLPRLDIPGVRRTLGTLLILAALIISGYAYPRWLAVQRAMRTGEPLPRSLLLPVTAAVLTVAGLIALATVFL